MNKYKYNKLTDKKILENRLIKELEDKYENIIEETVCELRNSLNIIKTSIYLLKRTQNSPVVDANKYIYQIEDSIRRSDNIITNLLDKNLIIRSKKVTS